MRKLVLALLLLAPAARAIPPPMSAEELARRAELVVEAESKSTACVGEPSDRGDFVSTEYRSELAVTRVISGQPPPGPIALSGWVIEWKNVRPDGAVPPAPPLPKGWRGTLHLTSAPGGGWMPVWYNAIADDPATSRPEPLPKCAASRGCGSCTLASERPDGAALLAALVVVALARRQARRSALTRWSNA